MDNKVYNTLEYWKVMHKLENHAATLIGKEIAMALKPSDSIDHVNVQLQQTDEAYKIERLKGNAPFGGIKDCREAIKRARLGGLLHAKELADISTTIYGSRKLSKFLAAIHENDPIEQLEAISSQLSDQQALYKDINACIDEQAEVLDYASPELARVRHEIKTGESRIREQLERMIRSSTIAKMLQDQLITIRNDRYVIPVKQEYRSHFGGIVHDQSGSGATLFVEPEVIMTLNNKLREAKLKEEQEIERILRRLSALVEEQADTLLNDCDVLGHLDVIFAKASLAFEMKASLPQMNDRGVIRLRRARHPLIDPSQVVPTDVEIGETFTTIIVTGPNTGGKTVSLKTIGLLSLMAMIGLFIPAEDGSQMCLFDAIYVDIGDEQSIEQSLSTFSSHMTNIIRILDQMTSRSLILLDELGAGTDPAEGSALAIAILDHMHQKGSRIIATTHYSELKAYAFNREGIMNASMEFDVQTLRPTYRLLIGIPGRSNAFAISQRLGLSTHIIEQAKGKVKAEDLQVESMIASLEENRRGAETEYEKALEQKREYEQLKQKYEKQLIRVEAKRDKIVEQAEEQARVIVEKARKDTEEVIRELRQLAQEEGAFVKEHKLIAARKQLDELEPQRKPTKGVKPSKAKQQREIQVGDEVHVFQFNQKGHVVELLSSNEALVQLGMMKMKIQKSDLELVTSSPAQATKSTQHVTAIKRTRDDTTRMELDLRGKNLEESLLEVDRFIDEAFLANLGKLYIIHGKGTGILRTGIQQYLKKHKHVNNYRLGEYGEGGSGVTVVELV